MFETTTRNFFINYHKLLVLGLELLNTLGWPEILAKKRFRLVAYTCKQNPGGDLHASSEGDQPNQHIPILSLSTPSTFDRPTDLSETFFVELDSQLDRCILN